MLKAVRGQLLTLAHSVRASPYALAHAGRPSLHVLIRSVQLQYEVSKEPLEEDTNMSCKYQIQLLGGCVLG